MQVLEPALCKDEGDNFRSLYETTFKALAAAGVPLNLVTFYDDLGENYEWAVRLPVAAVSLDFCGVVRLNVLALHKSGFAQQVACS